jgi:hypothetical protein
MAKKRTGAALRESPRKKDKRESESQESPEDESEVEETSVVPKAAPKKPSATQQAARDVVKQRADTFYAEKEGTVTLEQAREVGSSLFSLLLFSVSLVLALFR